MLRKLYLVILFVMVASAEGIGQARALKFDEFTADARPTYFFFDAEITYKERLARLIRQLNKERRGTKVYLIHYRARVSSGRDSVSHWRANSSEWEITSRTKLKYDDVMVMDGGVRDSDTLEFWIVRKNALPPEATPQYANSDVVDCPSIWLNAQEFHVDNDKPAVFSVGLSPTTEGKFDWKVSAGTILEGQGTETIKVDVKGLQRLTVTVLASDVPGECPRQRRETFEIGPHRILVDEFGGLPESDLRSRMDAFFSAISNEPSYRGYLIIYGRRALPRTLDAAFRLVTNHLAFRNFPKERIDVLRGGYKDEGGMEMWLLPPGTTAPKPRPTVDSKFLQTPATRRPRK